MNSSDIRVPESQMQFVSSHIGNIKSVVGYLDKHRNSDFFPIDELLDSLYEIRESAGETMGGLNQISLLIKKAFHRYRPEHAEQALFAVAIYDNFLNINNEIPSYINILQEWKTLFLSKEKEDVVEHYKNQVDRLINICVSVLDTLARYILTPAHDTFLRNMADGKIQATADKPSEYDEERRDMMYKKEMYDNVSGSGLTLKVLRECLQNSSDAVLNKKLLKDKSHTPTIEISLVKIGRDNNSYLDMSIKDNGVGMDIATLKQKFLVVFSTGKETETGDTGGWGVGKRIIQETPEQGWAIQTGDAVASRFHKDLYFSQYTDQQEGFEFPRPSVQQSGATLNLYKLPFAWDSEIINLCSKYSISNRLHIYVNGQKVDPAFPIGTVQQLDADGSVVFKASTMNSTKSQENIAKEIIDSDYGEIKSLMEELTFDTEDGGHVSANLYISPVEAMGDSGSIYYMMNGQYQFDENYWVPSVNIIVNMSTNVRPGKSGYPMTQSRDGIRAPYKQKIDEVVTAVKTLVENINNGKMFKDGLTTYTLNGEKEAKLFDPRGSSGQRKTLELFGHGELFGGKEEDTAVNIANKMRRTVGNFDHSTQQLMEKMVGVLSDMGNSVVTDEDIEGMLNALDSPCYVHVEGSFISQELAYEKVGNTQTLILLWSRILDMVLDRVKMLGNRTEKYVPGLIFSQEALALYSPASPNQPFTSISINPISVGALLYPARFEKVIKGQAPDTFSKKETQFVSDSSDDITPTNKLTSFLMHSAIHEVCHFLHPDYRGNHENFHKTITAAEHLCAPLLGDIRDQVKSLLPSVKKETNDFITSLKQTLRAQTKEEEKDAKYLMRKQRKLEKERERERSHKNVFQSSNLSLDWYKMSKLHHTMSVEANNKSQTI